MNPKSSNIIITVVIIILVLLGVYVFFSIRPTAEQVQSYQTPVLVVPQDILTQNQPESIIKGYSANQPVPLQPNNITKDNPFSPN